MEGEGPRIRMRTLGTPHQGGWARLPRAPSFPRTLRRGWETHAPHVSFPPLGAPIADSGTRESTVPTPSASCSAQARLRTCPRPSPLCTGSVLSGSKADSPPTPCPEAKSNPGFVLDAQRDRADRRATRGSGPIAPTQNGLRPGRRPHVLGASADYFNWPLESMVMPPGPLFFLASFSLRVPIAFELQSFAAATSALTASALPKSTSALRR